MTCPACGKDVLDIDVKCASCGAALGASGAHRMIGSVMLGQYELVDVLGQGGMSVVFKGRHKLTNQEVALKILPPEMAAHSQVKSRFLEEAKALAALDHGNIVHLYNFGQENGCFVLAMQLVQGRTWERMIIEAERLDWATSCRIAIDVLRALEYAHASGIVHRDMKPSNVLVRERDGLATVMDFGIAKMTTTSTRLTATGQTMGTVRYMSPEQVRGQEVDLRTDLYSLGATLYESVTGETPFDGNTHFEIMTKHLSELPVAPSKRGVALPATVEEAVMRCLAKRPEDRFAGAREMRKQLEAALRDGDLGLVETQRLDRGVLGELRATSTPVAMPTARIAAGDAGSAGTRDDDAGDSLADRLEPAGDPAVGRPGGRAAIPRSGRRIPWLALGVAVLLGGGGAAAVVMMERAGAHPAVEIAGVALPKRQEVGALHVETDGTIEPAELARLYTSTLDAMRLYVHTHQLAALGSAAAGAPAELPELPDPVDVLLAVPGRALCEPTAYHNRQPPKDCATAASAIAIGAAGKHHLMVVSDRARLIVALRKGVAQAACEFSPLEDIKRVSEICDLTTLFAKSTN
jgi:tRNA A-37 threonylcarbamoyl transferase component Bud32